VTVTIGEDVLWPHQDFLTKSVKLEPIQKQMITDDWSGYRAQIQSVYSQIPPVMVFVDWGGANTPMETFAKLPTEQQISMLKLLSARCVEEGFLFVYPLHKEHLYDAVSQGTYEAIRELTNKITGAQLSTTVPLTTVTSTSSYTTETTIMPSPSAACTVFVDTVTVKESESTLLEGHFPIVITVVVIAGIPAGAKMLRKKKQGPS